MNNFNCYPIAFDKNAANPDIVINNLLETNQIPIRIVDDKNSDTYKELYSYMPTGSVVQFFIIVIVYLHKFEA